MNSSGPGVGPGDLVALESIEPLAKFGREPMTAQLPRQVQSGQMAKVPRLPLDSVPVFLVEPAVEPLYARRLVQTEQGARVRDELNPLLLFQGIGIGNSDRP